MGRPGIGHIFISKRAFPKYLNGVIKRFARLDSVSFPRLSAFLRIGWYCNVDHNWGYRPLPLVNSLVTLQGPYLFEPPSSYHTLFCLPSKMLPWLLHCFSLNHYSSNHVRMNKGNRGHVTPQPTFHKFVCKMPLVSFHSCPNHKTLLCEGSGN